MNNTEHISFKMGTTQRETSLQRIVVQWLNHALHDAQGRAQIRRLLEQHELPVIQLDERERTSRMQHKRHVAA